MFVKFARRVSSSCVCKFTTATTSSESNALRFFSTAKSSAPTTNSGTINIFDKNTKRMQKEQALKQPDSHVYDYLNVEVAQMLLDRVADVKRTFASALDLGCNKKILPGLLNKSDGIEHMEHFDMFSKTSSDSETMVLPYENNSFDLVLSSLNLHWENDLPQVLNEIKRVLKPDGCLIGAVYGMDTLYELRCSLQLAETEREGGMGVHVSPMIQGHQLSSLLFNAGYSMVTLDFDELVVRYPSMFELMRDLQGMGENNAAVNRRGPLHRDTMLAAASVYQAMYGTDNIEDGVPASFQLLFMIGWKPDKSQPKPLKPGSTPKGFAVKKDE